MEIERARLLVAQGAETSRLMGVDFVPLIPARARDGGSPESTVTILVEAKPGAPAPPRDRDDTVRRLEALRERYERDSPHRAFATGHTRIVFGEGDPCARLMFVGEAPGAEEDRTGRPFVGPAGKLLDRMIVAMGLVRAHVYIANVLKTRPPNNATPTIEEIAICAPYLFEQIEIVSPEAIVALGLPASRALLNTSDSMSRLRGHWHDFAPSPGGRTVPVMPTYHPAFLLRSYTEENRAKVWSDLRQVMSRLGLGAARPDRAARPE